MHYENIFSDFSAPAKQEWLDKIKTDLKTTSLERFDWQLEGTISLSPFQTQEDLASPYAPLKVKPGWEIGTAISISKMKESNFLALQLLNFGAQALTFDLRTATEKITFDILLEGIQLEWVSIHFVCQDLPKAFKKDLVDYIGRRGFDLREIKLSIQVCDLDISQNTITPQLLLKAQLPHLAPFTLGEFGEPRRDLTTDYLSQLLHQGNRLISQMQNQKNIALPRFAINLGENYLSNICYLRAFRLTWLNVLEAWQIQHADEPLLYCHILDSCYEDEHLQKISFTSQAASAIIAGADRITIRNVNVNDQLDEQRLSLNIQHLLQLESHFDWVADPAAGSYLLEKGTDRIANQIWNKFQQLEHG